MLAQRRQRPGPPDRARRSPRVALLVLLSQAALWPAAGAGWALVLIAGLVILWDEPAERAACRARRPRTLLALAASRRGRHRASSLAFSWFNVSLGDGVGDRTLPAATVSRRQPDYELGVGKLEVDLSRLPLDAAAGTSTREARHRRARSSSRAARR